MASQQRGTHPAGRLGGHGRSEENPHVRSHAGAGDLKRGRYRIRPSRFEIGQGVEHRRLPIEVGGQPVTPVPVQQRVKPEMDLAGQMRMQHLRRQR
jgi:hypothetical protein